MSPTVPVGALVVIRPLVSPAHAGQMIVFHPPGDSHTYIHRIVAVGPGPTYRTKGDNDPRADPWTVPAEDVIGRAATVVPDLGWLLRAGPVVAGAVAAAVIIGLLIPRWRRWAYLDAVCAALLLISLRLHPFVRWQLVTLTRSANRTHAWLFNTGILPIQLRARPGDTSVVASGHSANLAGPVDQHLTIAGTAHLAPWQWTPIALVCAAPLIAAVIIAWGRERHARRPNSRDRPPVSSATCNAGTSPSELRASSGTGSVASLRSASQASAFS